MELLQLHYFRTAARLEHMTKAAEELRIAQPALSKTIARLEADLGVPLFDRRNRQIRLNAYGKAFLAKVDVALAALEDGKRELADMAGRNQRSIRLATSTLNRLSSSLSAFRARFPEVNFRIFQMAPSALEEMVQLLEEGEADFLYTAATVDRPGIREMRVLDAEVYLAVPLGHRFGERRSIRLEEAADEAFVEYRAGHPFRKANDEFCRQAGIRPRVVCEVDEPSSLGSLVKAGLGVAFVPGCKGDDESGLKLVRIEHPVCRRVFTLAWQENRYLSKSALAFRDFLVHYQEELQEQGATAERLAK